MLSELINFQLPFMEQSDEAKTAIDAVLASDPDDTESLPDMPNFPKLKMWIYEGVYICQRFEYSLFKKHEASFNYNSFTIELLAV